MHHDRFQLGLFPRPRWENLQHSPDPLAGIKRTYFQGKGRVQGMGREEREGRGREGEEGERKEVDEGRGGERRKGKGRIAIPILVCFWRCCL